MAGRNEIAKTPNETGTQSAGDCPLPRVCAWGLSPSEPGQAPSQTMEPVAEQYVEVVRGTPTRLARDAGARLVVAAYRRLQ